MQSRSKVFQSLKFLYKKSLAVKVYGQLERYERGFSFKVLCVFITFNKIDFFVYILCIFSDFLNSCWLQVFCFLLLSILSGISWCYYCNLQLLLTMMMAKAMLVTLISCSQYEKDHHLYEMYIYFYRILKNEGGI